MKNENDYTIIIAWILVILGGASMLIYIALLFYNGIASVNGVIDLQGFGSFGDYVGGVVGSIWSLAAILFIYRTYVLQKNELNILREYNKFEKFQTTFFSLISLIETAKKNFTFNSHSNEKAFATFRNWLTETLKRYYLSSDQKKFQIQQIFRVNSTEYSLFPIQLIFEIIYLIEKQELETRDTYRKIFGSTFSANEKIYIHNLIHSGFLTEDEIPENLSKIIWVIDRWKVFKYTKGNVNFNAEVDV